MICQKRSWKKLTSALITPASPQGPHLLRIGASCWHLMPSNSVNYIFVKVQKFEHIPTRIFSAWGEKSITLLFIRTPSADILRMFIRYWLGQRRRTAIDSRTWGEDKLSPSVPHLTNIREDWWYTGCLLNIVFFSLKMWYSWTLPVLLQRRCSTCLVCVDTLTPKEKRERPEFGIF